MESRCRDRIQKDIERVHVCVSERVVSVVECVCCRGAKLASVRPLPKLHADART